MKSLYFYIMLPFFLLSPIHAKKVLVTGGCGFIGRHVVEALIARNDSVIILDNLCNDPKKRRGEDWDLFLEKIIKLDEKVTFYQMDVCNKDDVRSIFLDEKPDVICHLAARAGVRTSIQYPEKYIATNVLGTTNILELANEFNIKHIVIASSSSVYGESSTAPFKESEPCDKPSSPYAATKRMCELLAYTFHHLYGLSISCLRFFTVYGPRGRRDMAPFIILDALYTNKAFELNGNGTALRDFTYIDDIVDGILKAIDTPCGFEIFNLGRGEPITLTQFIETLERITKKKLLITQVQPAAGDVHLTYACPQKTLNLMGFKPKVSLEEGLVRLNEWYRNAFKIF